MHVNRWFFRNKTRGLVIYGVRVCFRLPKKAANAPPNVNLTDSQPTPIPQADVEFMKDKDYRKALGMLNHIANGTRPDISFTVNTLMRYASDPSPVSLASRSALYCIPKDYHEPCHYVPKGREHQANWIFGFVIC